jgi:hypothetical protein
MSRPAILRWLEARVHDSQLIVRQVGPETVVYDRRRHRAHCLRPLAAAVWRAYDGRRSSAEIAERVSSAQREPIDEAAVQVALRRLARAGLIEEAAARSAAAESGAPAASPRRREALRRVAALTGLAVLSVATPSPAQVGTCRPNGTQCSQNAQCCSNCCNAGSGRCGGGGCQAGAAAR